MVADMAADMEVDKVADMVADKKNSAICILFFSVIWYWNIAEGGDTPYAGVD